MEACLIACGLFAVCVRVFTPLSPHEGSIPALVYLPLPFLLWAAVRFGPLGVSSGLLVVALFSIAGTVQGRGPFATSGANDNVLSLQLFLLVSSLPLMFLAALIAERREKVNVLRESEARFRSMADSAPMLIWMSDEDKLCTFLNRGWLEFTGRTFDQELGNGWSEGVHADDFERCLATYAGAFDERREFSMEYRLRRHDGEYRWVFDKARTTIRARWDVSWLHRLCGRHYRPPAGGRGSRIAAPGGCASDACFRVGELSGAIAHEINQPLTAILSNAQAALHFLAQKSPDLVEIRDALQEIVDEDNRAGEVIYRLRNLLKKGESRVRASRCQQFGQFDNFAAEQRTHRPQDQRQG